MKRTKPKLIAGTLDLLLLKALSIKPMHGYALAQWIDDASGGTLYVEQGSLYPALYRMSKKGWIMSRTQTTDKQREIRVYRLTPNGRAQLVEEMDYWHHLSGATSQVLAVEKDA